jgi:hypothetical protein
MLAVQLDLDGTKHVVSGTIPLGELKAGESFAFDVFRIIATEYKEVYRLIRDEIRASKMIYFKRDSVVSGELHITVDRPDCGLNNVIFRAIFPLKSDRLSIRYVKCQKTYVVKPDIRWLKQDLRICGVIK